MYFDIKYFKYFQIISYSFVCIGDHSRKYTCQVFYTVYFSGHFITFYKILAIQ